jgi:hypothetical protein
MVEKPTQQTSKSQRKEKHTWAILFVGDKLRWIGDVEATTAEEAIDLGAKQFNRDPKKLMAERRRWTTY